MPRHVFENSEQLKQWCEEFVKEGYYIVYTTAENEIILEPKRSTRPQRYGYLKSVNAEKLAVEIAEEYNIPYIKLESYEWDLDKSPGVRVSVE